MNAAGMLGLVPDRRAPVLWGELGAFVTNPLSLRPRRPAAEPELIEYPGGFLLHTGLPNPGLAAAIQRYTRRWASADLPIIVHLMADRPEETARMLQRLESLENLIAVELGFAPQLAPDIILLAIERSLGELPLIVSLPAEQVLTLGPRAMDAGAAAVSLAAPRGALPLSPSPLLAKHSRREQGEGTGMRGLLSGRLYGPGLFPQALDTVANAARLGLPIIGGAGIYCEENVSVMLQAGALAVQLDTVLWKGGWGHEAT
jgi:dihydroorotate dehydrogenase (NAD+) catalytic subunit